MKPVYRFLHTAPVHCVFSILTLTGLGLMSFSAHIFAQDALDVPDTCESDYSQALRTRRAGNLQDAAHLFHSVHEECGDSFDISFQYGRTLMMLREYDTAVEFLDGAIEIRERYVKESRQPVPDATVYNVRGFAAIMLEDFEDAVEFFGKGIDDDSYESLPPETKMKLNNNAGIVYLALHRYEEAEEHFIRADKLGSTLARENLTKIKSIKDTLAEGDEDIPGIFAPVVWSVRDETRIGEVRGDVAAKLDTVVDNIHVYIMPNGRYALAHGSEYSYPKAKRLVDEARKEIYDAYVASVATWTRYEFP